MTRPPWKALAASLAGAAITSCFVAFDYDDYDTSGGSSGGDAAVEGGAGGATSGGGAPGGGGVGGCDTSACGPAGDCFDWSCSCGKVNKPSGSPCGHSCVLGISTQKTCNPSGVCVSSTSDCSPYTCDPATNACRTKCVQTSDCADSFMCSGDQCVDCRTCGEWLTDVQVPLLCPGATGCAQWTNLVQNCCSASTCQSACSGSGDLCAGGNTSCYSSGPPSSTCSQCLQGKNPCASYLSLCEQDKGHL